MILPAFWLFSATTASGASGTGICLSTVLSRPEPVRWSARPLRRGRHYIFRLLAAASPASPAAAPASAASETRRPGPRAAEIRPVPLRRPFWNETTKK